MFRIPIIAIAAAVWLTGCDPSREEPPPDIEDTIFDEQVRALDKARGVEDIQDEHMKKLREDVEKAEGN